MSTLDIKNITETSYKVYFKDFRLRLSLLCTIRNMSAHYARLRNRNYITRPRVNDSVLQGKYMVAVSENNVPEVVSNMFNVCLIIKYLLDVVTP